MDIDQPENIEPMHTPTCAPPCSPELDGIASFLPPGFNSLEDYLACLQSFLDRCEPITSLMIVDYFTTNSWESRMPQEWREAFESKKGKLSSLDLMELVSLGKLRDYNAPPAGTDAFSSNGSAHTDDTTLGDQEDGPKDWPESLKDFVRMVKELSINRTLDPDYAKFKDTLDIHLIPGMSPKKLHEVEILSGLMASYAKEHSIRSVIDLGAGQGYLSRVLAFQHQLCVLGVDSNTIQTCGAQTTQKRTEKLFVNKTKLKRAGGGGSKKASKQSRLAASSASQSQSPSPAVSPPPTAAPTEASITEVATTAAAVATILTTVATDHDSTLDTPLALSSPSTQQAAELSFESPVDKVCKKLKTEESRSRSSSPATDSCGGNSSGGGGAGGAGGAGVAKKPSRSRRSKTRKTEDVSHIPSSELNLNSTNIASSRAGSESKAGGAKRGKSNTPTSTQAQTAGMAPAAADASMPLTGQKTIDSSNDPSLAATPGSNFQLQHITHHITAATLPTLLKEHFPKKSKAASSDNPNNGDSENAEKASQGEGEGEMDDEEGRWTLCGLHACGDLTSNMIKLFLESSATCLFSVGCCYHWITERYDSDGNIVISDGTHGFPLSAAFNRYKAHLGEHAKMIACQSPERWLKYQKESEDAIHGHYFRALLHKLMVERGLYPGPPTTAPVLGRMGKHRLRGFPHYLATALHRLSLPADAIRPEEAQAAYEQFLEKDLYRIGILWALRTMLGPLFEGMILLDRATYLHENVVGGNNSSNNDASKKKASVQLVAGFDVVESPRNMILIALKD